MMKKVLLLLSLPVVLFAQAVVVDTMIELGDYADLIYLLTGHYLPEVNKLAIGSAFDVVVLDCSTWEATIYPVRDTLTGPSGLNRFAWNPARRKLYVTFDHMDSCLVIYPDTDSSFWIPSGFRDVEYDAAEDLLYAVRSGEVWVLDCAADTVVKRFPSPVPGFGTVRVQLDSVRDRVYVTLKPGAGPGRIAVYDTRTDSLLTIIGFEYSVPLGFHFHPTHPRAYHGAAPAFGTYPCAGVIDTENLKVVRRFPFLSYGYLDRGPVALNTLMDKVYIAGHYVTGQRLCTLFVIDCWTDSIIKGIEYVGRGSHNWVEWVPWVNWVFFDAHDHTHMAILDCSNDSVIIPELILPDQEWTPKYLQLDTLRRRIFAIGAKNTAVHVLRCVPAGVAEEPDPPVVARSGPTIVRGVLMLPGLGTRTELPERNSVMSRAVLLDISGRKVMDLQPGENDVRHLAPGVYFVRTALWERSPGRDFVRKVVIQR